MRRQNPPQSFLDKASDYEKYLSATAVGSAYALCAAISFGLLALLFAALVNDGVVNTSILTLGLFLLIAACPAALAITAFRRRPSDPFSDYIRKVAENWQQPLNVSEDRTSFKVLMASGEELCVNLSFHYPAEDQTVDTKVRLNVFVRAALERDCTTRSRVPTEREIETAIDDALEFVAAEADIPILYVEVRDVHKVRDVYSVVHDDLAPSEFLGTGWERTEFAPVLKAS